MPRCAPAVSAPAPASRRSKRQASVAAAKSLVEVPVQEERQPPSKRSRKTLQQSQENLQRIPAGIQTSLPQSVSDVESKGKMTTVQSETEAKQTICCPFCKKNFKMVNIKTHLIKEYYERSKKAFLHDIKNIQDGKASCPHTDENCVYATRKITLLQLCVHLGTTHNLLRKFLSADPAARHLLGLLYPDTQQLAQPLVPVKDEGTLPVSPMELETETNSEDVDDPSVDNSSKNPPVALRPLIKSDEIKTDGDGRFRVLGVRNHICKLCSGTKGRESRELNFLPDGLKELKRHYASCLWEREWSEQLLQFLPHHQGDHLQLAEDNRSAPGKIDTFGINWLYKCPFIDSNCDKVREKKEEKQWMSYKTYVTHCLVDHGMVELWLGGQVDPALTAVQEQLRAARERAGQPVPQPPTQPIMQEIHKCLLCGAKDKDGKEVKDAKNLSLDPERSRKDGIHYFFLKYHYANCLADRDLNIFLTTDLSKYHPDPDHQDDPDNPEMADPTQLPAQLGLTWANFTWADSKGNKQMYKCRQAGCSQQTSKRKIGYKEFVTHCSVYHGGLAEILGRHENPDVRQLASQYMSQ